MDIVKERSRVREVFMSVFINNHVDTIAVLFYSHIYVVGKLTK